MEKEIKIKQPKRGRGRPREIHIEWEAVERMCQIDANEEEIAFMLGCSSDTLYRRCLQDHGMTFQDYYKKHRSFGNITLRRAQMKTALGDPKNGIPPNPTMQIWLGKQRLGQQEKSHVENTGRNGGPIEMVNMSEAERKARILELLNKRDK